MSLGAILYKIKKQIEQNRRYEKLAKSQHVIIDKLGYADTKTVFEGNNYINGSVQECKIGYGSYIHQNSYLKNVEVGRFCAIGEDVNIRLFQHPIDMVSISPCFYGKDHPHLHTFVTDTYYDDLQLDEGGISVHIGSDVWIGRGASIRSGITIGDGAIIAAGAVVTRDVSPYAIVGGIPAKLIKYRFDEGKIDELLSIKWWNRDVAWFEEHGNEFRDVDGFIDLHKGDSK